MSQGKFSNPRPNRDEERQIEETFRRLTQKQTSGKAASQAKPKSRPAPQTRAEAAVRAKTGGEYHPPQIPEEPAEPSLEELLRETPLWTEPVEEAFPKPLEDSFDITFDQPIPASPETQRFSPDALRQEAAASHPIRQTPQVSARIPDDSREFPEDYPEESEEDSLDRFLAFFRRNRLSIVIALFAVALLLIVGAVSIFRSASDTDPYDGRILENIYIADVAVGGMTKEEAAAALKEATNQTYASMDMVVDFGTAQLRLSPKDTGIRVDVNAAVNEAFAYGRTGTDSEQQQAAEQLPYRSHTIGMLPYLNLDTDYVFSVLSDYAEDTGSTLTQTTYGLQGKQPALDAENFDEDAPTQILVITMGTPGIGFDVNSVYNQVLDAYSLHSFLVEVETTQSAQEPDPVDLEAIYEEFYIAPKDASMDHQNYEMIPGSYGYGFDLEKARELVAAADFGEEIRIPMEYIAPEILEEEMFFRDEMGSYATPHTGNGSRNTNLRLACEALDGIVIDPGKTFSFNTVVGSRTSSAGYKEAPACESRDGEKTGGGVCQVASTLYAAALMADLEILERSEHDFVPGYIDFGMDADVDSADLRMRNNSSYPVQISAEVSNSKVSIRILGTDDRDYYIQLEYEITKTLKPETEYEDFPYNNRYGYEDGDVIEEGITGYQVKTYKCKYSRDTGRMTSRDYETTTRYETVNRVVARVEEEPTEPETAPPTTLPAPTEPPAVETTVPEETEASVIFDGEPMPEGHGHDHKPSR